MTMSRGGGGNRWIYLAMIGSALAGVIASLVGMALVGLPRNQGQSGVASPAEGRDVAIDGCDACGMVIAVRESRSSSVAGSIPTAMVADGRGGAAGYEVWIRMGNGAQRVLRQQSRPSLEVGDAVIVTPGGLATAQR